MIVMADTFGADMRLVALMQYMRVLFVAIAASLIARLWLQASISATTTTWFPELHWLSFGETLCIIVISISLAPRLRIPGGWLLLPMIIGSTLQIAGLIQLELPPWLLGFSFALLGWTIGSRFTRESLAYAVRVLPAIILAILSIIAFCGLLALMLVYVLGVDLLTAYLATSPGGIDSAAIIAASTNVNMPFVMALQIMRLIISLLIGPPLALWTARRVEKHL
jgi:membrane AbrB-like protein